ncbi:cupin domain-containing protein [Mycetocola spongiae]|uniref:cupin domain-containing protein n=1 Tax=Mycetocola spongiae TaxID=2859226 RepID=UPI001CF227B1|nr:cupin domain-containing protein [Mycetocola spongiae]UCR88590.1 cupin domain-containing protein [Mycetocola spongiae]
MTPVVLNRPDTAESRGQIRFFFILSGRMTLTQAGRTVTLGPGDSAVTIGWQPYLAEILEPTMLIGAALGRDVLDSRGIVYPHAVRKLPAPSLLANGMTGFFMGLFEARLYPLSLEQTTRLTRVFDTFMVELHLGYVEESKDPDDRLAEQRDAILEFARARAEREAVSVASVAEHYNMSTRSLQRLFQNAPRSLRDELRLIQEATNE